jgi:hypothetical protein
MLPAKLGIVAKSRRQGARRLAIRTPGAQIKPTVMATPWQ